MRVLVTGGSGYLGAEVLKAAAARGWETVAAGRCEPEAAHSRFIEADLLGGTDPRRLVMDAKADCLIHMAWYAEPGKYWTSPLNLRWVDASVRLVEAFCAAGGARVVGAGTCAEYLWDGKILDEGASKLAPASLYGTAKDAARRLMAAVCAGAGTSFAWGRIFFPYGGEEAGARLVPSLIRALRGRREPFGVNRAASRDFIHVSDIGHAFACLAEAGEEGCFNVSTGEPVSIETMVRTLAEILRADPEPILKLASARPCEPGSIVGDASRLRSVGWAPRIGLREGLKAAVAIEGGRA